MGLLPTESEIHYINGTLNQEVTTTIAFKNPFKEQISVVVHLEPEGAKDAEVFDLLLKKKKLVIPAKSTTELPICFVPLEMS